MYVKNGNLVDADASGAKASKKHLESRFKVTHFGITEKLTKGALVCVLL